MKVESIGVILKLNSKIIFIRLLSRNYQCFDIEIVIERKYTVLYKAKNEYDMPIYLPY